MNDIAEAAKNNPGLSAVIVAMVLGGGGIFYSEGAEEEESELHTAELRATDIRQDTRVDGIEDGYHDLDKRLALLQQQVCMLSQGNIPSCD